MSVQAPYHLAKFDTTKEPSFDSELVFRRCPFGNKTPPVNLTDMFLAISWDDLVEGLSVNRSKYSAPEDALWSPTSEDTPNRKCVYVEKRGVVYSSQATLYPAIDGKTGVSCSLEHTPIPCNISHCDISITNLPAAPVKPLKRDIKAFISTLFQEI